MKNIKKFMEGAIPLNTTAAWTPYGQSMCLSSWTFRHKIWKTGQNRTFYWGSWFKDRLEL